MRAICSPTEICKKQSLYITLINKHVYYNKLSTHTLDVYRMMMHILREGYNIIHLTHLQHYIKFTISKIAKVFQKQEFKHTIQVLNLTRLKENIIYI